MDMKELMHGYRIKCKNWMILIIAVVIITAIIMLFFFNPISYSFFPKCIFYQLTGLKCPSCGSQRAVHLILNGEFYEGIKYNPFMVISIPYISAIISTYLFNNPVAIHFRKLFLHRKVVNVYVIFYITWWIIRNFI